MTVMNSYSGSRSVTMRQITVSSRSPAAAFRCAELRRHGLHGSRRSNLRSQPQRCTQNVRDYSLQESTQEESSTSCHQAFSQPVCQRRLLLAGLTLLPAVVQDTKPASASFGDVFKKLGELESAVVEELKELEEEAEYEVGEMERAVAGELGDLERMALREIQLSDIVYTEDECLEGAYIIEGKTVCISVTATADNPSSKEITEAGVYGFIVDFNGKAAIAEPKGGNRKGLATIPAPVPPGTSKVKFQLAAYKSSLDKGPLKFESLKAVKKQVEIAAEGACEASFTCEDDELDAFDSQLVASF